MLSRIRNLMAKDLGIDLGTANFVIYEKGFGIKLNQPSTLVHDVVNNFEFQLYSCILAFLCS